MTDSNMQSVARAWAGTGLNIRPVKKRDEMVCARTERENDALDVETRDKLGEYGIYGLILCYKVIRLCRERKMLRLLRLVVRRGVI